jgi:predicted secreted protein
VECNLIETAKLLLSLSMQIIACCCPVVCSLQAPRVAKSLQKYSLINY